MTWVIIPKLLETLEGSPQWECHTFLDFTPRNAHKVLTETRENLLHLGQREGTASI